MLVDPVHPSNASLHNNSILSGIIMLVNPVHLSNANTSITITLSGIIMFVRLVQLRNAQLPIEVIPFTIETSLTSFLFTIGELLKSFICPFPYMYKYPFS